MSKPDFESVAEMIYHRCLSTSMPRETRALIVAQLDVTYQEGVCDGLKQGEEAVRKAFAKGAVK